MVTRFIRTKLMLVYPSVWNLISTIISVHIYHQYLLHSLIQSVPVVELNLIRQAQSAAMSIYLEIITACEVRNLANFSTSQTHNGVFLISTTPM